MAASKYPTIEDLPELLKDVPDDVVGEVAQLATKMMNHEAYGQP